MLYIIIIIIILYWHPQALVEVCESYSLWIHEKHAW